LVAKNVELIDNYQVGMLWFDNGVNPRAYDPLNRRAMPTLRFKERVTCEANLSRPLS
jgi:hypothetical protein